jgi:hypothetical protein
MIVELVTRLDYPSLLKEPQRTSRFTTAEGYHINLDDNHTVAVGHVSVDGELLIIPLANCQFMLWKKPAEVPAEQPVTVPMPQKGKRRV